MSDNETETRFRLMPLDKSGFVYLGIDVTNGNQAALLVILGEHLTAPVDQYDLLFRDIANTFLLYGFELGTKEHRTLVEIDGKGYSVIPWNNEVDRTLVGMIDRLINMRMKNASVVSMAFQLELPLR